MLSAELAYLFRHGLVRDSAYQLQTPSARAKLHELAFYSIEANNGARAPEPIGKYRRWYNEGRIHSSIGYMTPNDYAAKQKQAVIVS